MFYEWLCMLCAPMHVERITMDNLPRVIALFASNPGYFSCVQSHPVDAHECEADITMLPPGKTLSDKTYVLVSDDAGDLAVIDFVEQYPDEKTGYLGFLIVSGGRHGCGMGSVLLSKIEQAASECGFHGWSLAAMKRTRAVWRFGERRAFHQFVLQNRKQMAVFIALLRWRRRYRRK